MGRVVWLAVVGMLSACMIGDEQAEDIEGAEEAVASSIGTPGTWFLCGGQWYFCDDYDPYGSPETVVSYDCGPYNPASNACYTGFSSAGPWCKMTCEDCRPAAATGFFDTSTAGSTGTPD